MTKANDFHKIKAGDDIMGYNEKIRASGKLPRTPEHKSHICDEVFEFCFQAESPFAI